jgi:hypothetical protein
MKFSTDTSLIKHKNSQILSIVTVSSFSKFSSCQFLYVTAVPYWNVYKSGFKHCE